MIRTLEERTNPIAYRQAHVWYAGERYSPAEMERRRHGWSPGLPWPDEVRVVVGTPLDGECALPHVVLHSPSGFEWGYGGSGPSDLALSILADYLGEDPEAVRASGKSHLARPTLAFKLHCLFTGSIIARLAPGPGIHCYWRLTGRDIRAWLETSAQAAEIQQQHPAHVAEWEAWQREDAALAALEEAADDLPF